MPPITTLPLDPPSSSCTLRNTSSRASRSSSRASASSSSASSTASTSTTATSAAPAPAAPVDPDQARRRALTDVNVRVAKAKKVVVVSGAGISCSSGIPDFRSENGLYSLVKARYPDTLVSGKELFSSGLFANPATASIFYTFIAELSLACAGASPTRTHHFIHRLESKGKLLRSYTQNVDGLERRLGLESGGRGNGLKKVGTRNVELHGDLGRVRCVLCYTDYEALPEWVSMFREGEAPDCPACEERCISRMNRAARATAIGTLRPSIVLYDEPHPLGDDIGELQAHDMKRGPDVLLIMGTSLKVHGLKRLVKDFAKVVHERKGVVVFVNATPPSKEWEGVIDFHIQGETDRWVDRVEEEWKRVRPQDWERQTVLDGDVVHESVAGKKKRGRKGEPVVRIPPFQLPTPPASQQTPEHSPSKSSSRAGSRAGSPRESPRRSPRLSVPPSSTPLTELSSPSISPLSSPPASPFIRATPLPAPPTPVSPGKRQHTHSAGGASQQVLNKKSRTKPAPPATGLAASPGRGNLFTTSTKDNCPPLDQGIADQDMADEAVFGLKPAPAAPGMRRSRSLRLKSCTSTTAVGGAAAGDGKKGRTLTARSLRRTVSSADAEAQNTALPPQRAQRVTRRMASISLRA